MVLDTQSDGPTDYNFPIRPDKGMFAPHKLFKQETKMQTDSLYYLFFANCSDHDYYIFAFKKLTIGYRLSCGFSYYAISFGVQQLSGYLYLNLALLSFVEIPTNLMIWFLAKW
ncbi:hypothetical protein KUTeg_012377 [Tegillarca granosa]|uniref:Transmembrane protein n=1 Tax=Tegillarca granosa TaxID=220873 RepID=A0ABQ9F3N9_TEGGR|nr:hypothetical protein KUTeg_012377 [Tegillarca granosa]